MGTLALYDNEGERQHTIYLAASPEYGKATFLGQLEQEIAQIKQTHPQAHYVGIADGARCNWRFPAKHTDSQTIDFWHAAEYLGQAAGVMFPGPRRARDKTQWLEQACHKLKHQVGAATRLWKEMKAFGEAHSLPESDQASL